MKKENHYRDPTQFADDVRQVINNALSYHFRHWQHERPHEKARLLRQIFEKHYAVNFAPKSTRQAFSGTKRKLPDDVIPGPPPKRQRMDGEDSPTDNPPQSASTEESKTDSQPPPLVIDLAGGTETPLASRVPPPIRPYGLFGFQLVSLLVSLLSQELDQRRITKFVQHHAQHVAQVSQQCEPDRNLFNPDWLDERIV